MLEVLDPTHGDEGADFVPAPRLPTLRGATVGVISNGKQGTREFFDAFSAELREQFGVAEVVRVTKPNYSAPAGDDVFEAAREWQAVVAGVGD